ncbi:hypothetical protein HK105_205180 [Polyrhizophydium stewartii]|uniref:LPXTG-domain-containing protein n=1 Tax=Polyrhizophydium stewartii TaxID=2732419 RepID=A0ABR4N746_9FUNG
MWVQLVSVPLCRNSSVLFPADKLSVDDIVPATLPGTPRMCIPDPEGSNSVYHEISSSLDSLKRFDEIKSKVVTRFGGAAIASAFFVAFNTTHEQDPKAQCTKPPVAISVYYLIEDCIQGTPSRWIKSVFSSGDTYSTYACSGSDCMTNCSQVMMPYKPAPPNVTVCHPGAKYDGLYTDALALKTNSDYAQPNPKNTWPTISPARPPMVPPTSTSSGTLSISLPALIGICAGAAVLLIALVTAVVVASRRKQGARIKQHQASCSMTPHVESSPSAPLARSSSPQIVALSYSASQSTAAASSAQPRSETGLLQHPPQIQVPRRPDVLVPVWVAQSNAESSTSSEHTFQQPNDAPPSMQQYPIVEPPATTYMSYEPAYPHQYEAVYAQPYSQPYAQPVYPQQHPQSFAQPYPSTDSEGRPLVALAVLALAAQPAGAYWLQLCRSLAATFTADKLSMDDIVPARLPGSPPACIVDPDSSSSVYYELQPSAGITTEFICAQPNCSNCSSTVLHQIDDLAQPDCGDYYHILASNRTLSLSEAKDGLVKKFGGASIASASVVALASRRDPNMPDAAALCSAPITLASAYYIFEDCVQGTPTSWLVSRFESNNRFRTYVCPTRDCNSNCTSVINPMLPAPPGMQACHPDNNYDYLYADADPIKSSSEYAGSSPVHVSPREGAVPQSMATGKNSSSDANPKNDSQENTASLSLPAIIGVAAALFVVLGVAVAAAVIAFRRYGAARDRERDGFAPGTRSGLLAGQDEPASPSSSTHFALPLGTAKVPDRRNPPRELGSQTGLPLPMGSVRMANPSHESLASSPQLQPSQQPDPSNISRQEPFGTAPEPLVPPPRKNFGAHLGRATTAWSTIDRMFPIVEPRTAGAPVGTRSQASQVSSTSSSQPLVPSQLRSTSGTHPAQSL